MQVRLPCSGWMLRALLIAAVVPLLAECGPARNQFAPICPNQGPSRDLTDLIVSARIVQIHGSCQPGAKNRLAVAVSVNVEMTRGPALPGNGVTVPIFVAVAQGDNILDKHTYLMHATFPSNVDRVTLTPGELDLSLPITSSRTGAAYTLLAGFQLTPEQLQQGQQRP